MIVFVRHGEAAAGWGDHPDPGLSERGVTQAQAAAERVKSLGATQILSSPMQRCQDTAAAYAKLIDAPVKIEPRVSEIPTPPGIADRVVWLRSLMAGQWSETEELIQTWRQTLIDCVSDLPDNTVVFSHFVAINALVGHLEQTDKVTVFRPNHCSLTLVEKTANALRLKQRGDDASTRVL